MIVRRLSVLTLAAAVAWAAPRAAEAQELGATAVGVAEVHGDDVTLFLIGANAFRPIHGWGWTAGVNTYRLSFPSGNGTDAIFAVTPSVGLRYGHPEGAGSVRMGYSLRSDDAGFSFFEGASGGVVTSAQADYWGMGNVGLQWLGSYGWGSEFLWTRFRGTGAVARMDAGGMHVGGEIVWQGDTGDGGYEASQYGPVLQWSGDNGVIAVLGGGIKNSNLSEDNTWYAKVELVLTRLGSRFSHRR